MTTETGPRDVPAPRQEPAGEERVRPPGGEPGHPTQSPGPGRPAREPGRGRPARPGARFPALLPGLLLAAVVTAVVLAAAPVLPTVSPLVLALLVGAVAGSAFGSAARAHERASRWRDRLRPGTAWTATHVLRAGVVLLGFQVSLPEVLALGWRGLAVVGVTMAATLAGTIALGRWLGLSRATSLLVATGYAVCGAAAVSAMRGVLDDDERDDEAAATALALVTLFGSVAILALPWLAGLLGLTDHDAGLWIGASVQEVAQVVTAAESVSGPALATATVAKLTRVALLVPLIAVAGIVAARRRRVTGTGVASRRAQPVVPSASAALGHEELHSTTPPRRRSAPVPLFVVGFALAVTLRSVDVLPAGWIAVLVHASQILFVAAMFAMGLGIDAVHLIRTGRRALVLGALAAVLVTGVALVGVLV